MDLIHAYPISVFEFICCHLLWLFNSVNAYGSSVVWGTHFYINYLFPYVFGSFILIINSNQPVQEPEKMTETIVKALETTGQRGIINKGWGGLGNCRFRYSILITLNPWDSNICWYLRLYDRCGREYMLNYLFSVAEPKDFVYLLDNCPHDWLFLRCLAVVKKILSIHFYLFIFFCFGWNICIGISFSGCHYHVMWMSILI